MPIRLPGNSLPVTLPTNTANENNLSQAGNSIISNNTRNFNVNVSSASSTNFFNVSNSSNFNIDLFNLNNFNIDDFSVTGIVDYSTYRLSDELDFTYEETYSRELVNINKSLLSSYEYNDITLDLMFDITGNDLNDEIQPIEKINIIANTKNLIIEKLFQNCDSQFKSVLKKTNSYQFVIDTIKQKLENTNELKILFEEGTIQRDNTIKLLDYSDKLNNFIIKKAQGKEFSRISNYFIDTYKNLENNSATLNNRKKDIFSFEENDPIARIKLNIDNETLSKYLMISYEGYDDISRTIDFTKIVVQNIVNNVRSMFTLMPNCMLFEENPDESGLFVEYKNDDEVVYKVERSNLKLWKFIDNNGKLNYDDFVFENSNIISLTNSIIPVRIIESNVEEEKLKAKSFGFNLFDVEEFIEGYVAYQFSSMSFQPAISSSDSVTFLAGNVLTDSDTNTFLDNATLNSDNSSLSLELSDNSSLSLELSFQSNIKNTRIDSRLLKVRPDRNIANTSNLIRLQNINPTGTTEIYDTFKILKINNNISTLFNKILISQITKPSYSFLNGYTQQIAIKKTASFFMSFQQIGFLLAYNPIESEFNYDFDEASNDTFSVTDNSTTKFNIITDNLSIIDSYKSYYTRDSESWNFLNDKAPRLSVYFRHVGDYNLYYKYKALINDTSEYFFNKNFEIKIQESNYVNFDKEKFVLKLDSFIKRVKLEHLKSKNIDTSVFKDVLNNIKSSRNNYLSTAYLKNDKDNISILNSENSLYQFMFDEKEEFVSSNISYAMKSHVFKDTLYTAATIPTYKEKIADNINDIFSNYYPENDYFSSTKFLESVIKDFNDYMETFNNNSANKKDIYVTDLLYLNYFSENNQNSKEEVKNEIAKRFMLETLKNDIVSSARIKNQTLNKYKYNNKSFDTIIDDFNKLGLPEDTSGLDFRKNLRELFNTAYDEYRSSSKPLDTIHKEIFSNQYFNFIKEEYNLCLININYYYGKIFKIEQTFPFYHEVFFDMIYNLNSENIKRKIKLNKNLVPFCKTYIEEESLKLSLNADDLNYFTDGNIHLKTDILNLKVQSEINSTVSKDSRQNYITDTFESNMNDNTSILYKIKNKIKSLFRQQIGNYEELYFSSEEEMLSFIESNTVIQEHVLEIIELYSEFFVDVSKKINFDFNTKLFSQIIDPYFEGESDLLIDKKTIREFVYNIDGDDLPGAPYISHFNSFYFTQESLSVFNKKEGRQGKIFNYTVSDVIKQYYLDLMNVFSKNEFSLEDEVISNANNQFDSTKPLYIQKTNEDSFCQKMHEVISILKKSDYYQAVSFDLTREMLRTSKNIVDNIEKINNENLIELSNRLEANEEEFFRNINNNYYRNILNRNIYNVLTRNNEISTGILAQIESEDNTLSLEDSLNEIQIFDKYKAEYKYKNVNLNDDIIYAFSLPYSKLQNINDDTLIKITLMPKDLIYSNRLFYPIIFYFSTNILQTNFNMLNNEDNFKYYENASLNNNLSTHNTNFDRTNIAMTEYLRQIVIRKLSPKTDDEVENYLNNIIESHRRSVEINKLLYIKHDINLEKIKSPGNKVLSVVTERLSDNAVKNIFDVEKTDIINNFSSFENSLNSVSLMNDNLNNLLSIEKDNKEVLDTTSYDKYVISLDHNSLIYNDINETSSNMITQDFMTQNIYNKTSLYEIANKHQTEYVFKRYNTLNISEREFLTFVVKTEIL